MCLTPLLLSTLALWALVGLSGAGVAVAAEGSTAPMYIREYRVQGATKLPKVEVEDAVYPFLGPGRTPADVEGARQALEQAYRAQGYQTVSVQIPAQEAKRGIVRLEVIEAPVGRLRVKGSRYFDLDAIKERARSLAEGNVVNFNDVTPDIVGLNQFPDRRITPSVQAGSVDGTVDVTLNVEDTFPLHGSLEYNNRSSVGTTPTRLNGSLSYNNLWQLGHTVGFGFQIAPEDPEEVTVLSGYYIARFSGLEWFSLMAQAVKQDSNVSTLGGVGVAGRGDVLGLRAIVTLPPRKDFFHSISAGFDYKNFEQSVDFGGVTSTTPVTYYPVSLTYNAAWLGKGYVTNLQSSVVFSFRGLGSDREEFDQNRFNSDGSFLYLRGEGSHTQELPVGFQAAATVQGQASGGPLVNSEQFAAGGLDTVRGYLEAEALGDSAIAGSLELRSPSLLAWWKGLKESEMRLFGFVDAAYLGINDPLPEQQSRFELASVGFGGRVRLLNHLNGALQVAWPLVDQSSTQAGDVRLLFRVAGEF